MQQVLVRMTPELHAAIKAQAAHLGISLNALCVTRIAGDLGLAPSAGVARISRERTRQIVVEGWNSVHDDQYTAGQLALAAICYADPEPKLERTRFIRDDGTPVGMLVPTAWPWLPEWYKPTPDDQPKQLAKAGALIAAEIDRRDRVAKRIHASRQAG